MKEVKFISANWGKYDPQSLDGYINLGGMAALKQAVTMDGEDIASLLSKAKIKGRGGAAYAMGRKWSQARAVPGERKVIICNADEGETCTFKDREAIKHDPYNLLEGMIIAGYVCRACEGYIYLREEYSHLRPTLRNAISKLEQAGYLGDDILGVKGFSFHVHLYSGAGAYVCGEGTALIRSIEGKAGRPRMKPPFIKQSGLFALPTCINNVESLSIVPRLLRDPDTYMSYGSGESIGTKLISLGGNIREAGVYEIPFGVTVRDIVFGLGQGIPDGRALRLIQFGGASGKLSDTRILDTPYTYETLKASGVDVGTGSLLVVDKRTTVLDFLRLTQEFFSRESCGQCTPCREGNLHIKILLDKLASGEATANDVARMKQLALIMQRSSLCGLGESAQNALLSAMKVFPETFEIYDAAAGLVG